jgi:hypothetical protein
MTHLTLYSDNLCRRVRTPRIEDEHGHWQERSPAMAAGMTDHAWTWEEWFNRPAVHSS